jgi:hypothetical protein
MGLPDMVMMVMMGHGPSEKAGIALIDMLYYNTCHGISKARPRSSRAAQDFRPAP